MSLNGNLEDIPLLDILQIIAFSQKTGYLTVQASGGEAALVFRDGLVVSATTPDSLPRDPRVAQLTEEKRGALIRQRVEVALEQLIRLREGAFCFTLTAEPPATVGSHDISSLILGRGIKPEELLLELTRSMDEDRRDSVALVESGFAEPLEEPGETGSAEAEAVGPAPREERPLDPPPETVTDPPAADDHRIVLLLEDEDDLRESLAQRLIDSDYQVVEAGQPSAAVRKAKGLGDVGLPFTLVADRGMPASDGSSFNGGLEVVERLHKAGLHPPVLLMTDRMTRTLYARARRVGVSRWVFKPVLSRLDPAQFEADLRVFGDRLLEILPRLQEGVEAAPPSRPSSFVPLPRNVESWDEVTTLRRWLEELSRPQDAHQVSLLVIKAARDFFERAVLFVVKDGELRGLGGFGPDADEVGLKARDLAIPLAEPSAFEEVVASTRPYRGPLSKNDWGRLGSILGRVRSPAVALLPLVAQRETIAVLLGDNPTTGADFRRLETLEVFINQAGLTLENASFRRRTRPETGAEARAPLP
ncbi:MAG TPA: response regulator [Vicinamibacteria bacterium]|nr:response regulator [Vicinamibacteria bacterium]